MEDDQEFYVQNRSTETGALYFASCFQYVDAVHNGKRGIFERNGDGICQKIIFFFITKFYFVQIEKNKNEVYIFVLKLTISYLCCVFSKWIDM